MPFWIPLGVAALLVLAIYLIRPTAQALPVASTVLWRRLLAARKRRRDRLRWLLSLLLATAVAGLLSVAASRAPWLQPGGGDPIALAFDPSPTMQARLCRMEAPAGIELAAAEARRIVAEAEAGSRFTVNADPAPLTSAEVLALLSGPLEALSNAADTEPAIPTARRVHVFTDGIGPFTPIIDPGTETQIVSVLVPARNAGIVRFATRPPATRASRSGSTARDPGDRSGRRSGAGRTDGRGLRNDPHPPATRARNPATRFTALIDLGSFAPRRRHGAHRNARRRLPARRPGRPDRRPRREHPGPPRSPPAHRVRAPTDPWLVVVIARQPGFVRRLRHGAAALEADASVDVAAVRAATGADDPPPEDPPPGGRHRHVSPDRAGDPSGDARPLPRPAAGGRGGRSLPRRRSAPLTTQDRPDPGLPPPPGRRLPPRPAGRPCRP